MVGINMAGKAIEKGKRKRSTETTGNSDTYIYAGCSDGLFEEGNG